MNILLSTRAIPGADLPDGIIVQAESVSHESMAEVCL